MQTPPYTTAIILLLGISAGLAWAGCSEDEAPAAPVLVGAEGPGSVNVQAVAVAPSHGGTVVQAGGYPVEVVPRASGQVYAYVDVASGPPPDAVLTVDVPVRGRATLRPVRLRWNGDRGRYEGRVRSLEIIPGPVDVHYEVEGRIYDGHVATVVVAPSVEVVVETNPGYDVEIVEPRVRVKHRKHRRRGKHRMRGKHRGRGGANIEIRF